MHKVKSCGTITYHIDHQQTHRFLVIKHQKTYHWGFPKGHQENEERDDQTALRETKEEVGMDVKIYYHLKDYVTYHPNSNVEKTVVYYLAKTLNHQCKIQKDEVLEARWLTYDETLKTLTYESDKHAFISIVHKAQKKHVFMNPNLIDFIKQHVLPIYKNLDPAHQIDHVEKVIEDALDMARYHDVYHHMIYVIASYHDVGMIHGREMHHVHGANMLANEATLKKWFTDEQIYIMKQAVIDHRASQKEPPQTIYGQIIAQADRDFDLDVIIKRIVDYGKDKHPNLPFEDFFEEGYQHLEEKYGKYGYMAIWIKTDETLKKVKELQDKIRNKHAIFERFYELFHQK